MPLLRSIQPADERPTIVISLDYEHRWGVHDRLGDDWESYREELENEDACVEKMLKMFDERGIHATWATVGAMACSGWQEYFARAPAPPAYEAAHLCVKPCYADRDPDGRLHFSPAMFAKILGTPHQDLASHTFSHLYLGEPGVTAADALADHAAIKSLFVERYGVEPISLVFPRNQIAFLSEMYNNGVEIVRGNETSWYFNCTAAADRTYLPRSLKLLDAFNPFARHPEPPTRGMTRSSGFVRFNLPRSLWHLHLARLKRPMRGGQPGIVHHYWWHPHNLGRNMDERISRLRQLLDVIADLIHTDKLKSLNMSELTKEARI
jgi:peptidoglycan/xylan/chitin deacetylase (PgdA/CDA1 family)